MHILVDIRHLTTAQPSGIGHYTTQLLRALFDIDQTHRYILLSSGTTKPNLESFPTNTEQITTVHIPTPNKLLNLKTLLFSHPTFNWYVREPIDLIFLPNLNIISLPTKIPTVLTIHDLSWKLFPYFYSQKMQWWHKAVRPNRLIRQATHLIVPSKSTAQDLQDVLAVAPDRLSIIPHGVDPQFSPRPQARDHGVRSRYKLPKRFVLFVGTLEPRKNILGLIEGVRLYRERSKDDLQMVLIGQWGWNATHLRHRLWKKEVKDWIHNLGYIPSQDRPALYRSAQIFTWPSFYEGFGLPVLEAMACATPVITSQTASLPELTKNAAILIDPYNPTDLMNSLSQLLSSEPLRHQLSARGLQQAQGYTWKTSAEKTLTVFESISTHRSQ